MESIELHYQAFMKAYNRLDYMSKKFLESYNKADKQNSDEEPEFVGYRDALIKRFEICYDLTWKLIKRYLNQRYQLDLSSPRKIFQELLIQGLASPEETSELLKMIEARNYTSHTYSELMAEEISLKVVDYAHLIIKIIHRLQ